MLVRLIIKLVWTVLGSLSFVGGLIGLVLPVIPQIPFFLLAIFCLAKVSPRFHNWITHWRIYQRYLLPVAERFNPQHWPMVRWFQQRFFLHNK